MSRESPLFTREFDAYATGMTISATHHLSRGDTADGEPIADAIARQGKPQIAAMVESSGGLQGGVTAQ